MKQVYVLRHAQKDDLGNLTDEGRDHAKLLQNRLPKFKIIITSDAPRTQETAFLLTGSKSQIDIRAGYFNAPQQINEAIHTEALRHPFGFVGAYLDNVDIAEEIVKKAHGFVDLIHETLSSIDEEEKALIVSHEITMVPAAKLFIKESDIKSFKYLSGYIISENNNLELLSL